MSSLRNAVKRITHKERSQPTHRAHLGILEKKKDYRIRSKDYHRKQDVLTNLRRKASMRNPDEFYFGMNNSEVKNGRHQKTLEAQQKEMEHLNPEAIKLMKSQDLSYIRTQVNMDEKKLERMKASLHFLGDNPYTNEEIDEENGEVDVKRMKKQKHTVFVDNEEKAKNFNVADHFETVPELAGRSFNRPRKQNLFKAAASDLSHTQHPTCDDDDNIPYQPSQKEQLKQSIQARKHTKAVAKARAAAYKEMEARKKRIALLKNAEAHLITQKIVASKGRKRKIAEKTEDGKPAIYKFRRKRSK